jgi:hypothetical protein
VGCKKSFREPLWRCNPCQVKKSRVLGEYKTKIDPVRFLLAQEARKKVKFDATQFITVKLLGHGLEALRCLHEVISDADPGAVEALQQVQGKRGGQQVKWSFKVTAAEGLHTLFGPAFRGVTESGFVAISQAGVLAFHPPVVVAMQVSRAYGSIPTLSLTASSCCLTRAGVFRFTKPYMKADLRAWRVQVMSGVRDAIGLVLQGTVDASARAALLTPEMRATLRALP